jgi:hypothetical protein
MDQELYTIADFAALRKDSENKIEDYLRQGLLFCTVRLTPNIYKKFTKSKANFDGAEEIEDEEGHYFLFHPPNVYFEEIAYANERRDDEYILQNYCDVVDDDENSYIHLENAEFKRFKDNGFIYKVFASDILPQVKKKSLRISKEMVERFEKECQGITNNSGETDAQLV